MARGWVAHVVSAVRRSAPSSRGFIFWNSWRLSSSKSGDQEGFKKEPLKKPKTPVGRFDHPQKDPLGGDLLEKFPDDINPVTKEKNGPRGPEPTRYGDWERRGRCIDF
ncbi:succinate dehydrogenase assembly factor 4, mitochondrial [Narcine bancroftii]|uniref:succinate dehydrogenase assembly factor 4, mitochondrial n=1 Tax=Narcine bancroftii TaxID=1343680 RepID=UPI0038316AA5